MFPQAVVLEAYGYLELAAPRVVAAPTPHSFGIPETITLPQVVYRLTPKAFDLLEPSVSKVSVFISYRRSVSSLQALVLSNWLHRNQVENFLDIRAGDEGGLLQPFIIEAIKSRSHFVCLLGEITIDEGKENTLKSDWVKQEIRYALDHKKMIVPFWQHDWSTDALSKEEMELSNELDKFQGVPTPKSHDYSSFAQLYDDALRKLLPYLNKSRT
jgi:hypothetical protein